jgi:hypothetical protein
MASIETELTPFAITFPTARKISGFGFTTLWRLGKEGRIKLIRIPGVQRTLIAYPSLKELLTPCEPAPPPQRLLPPTEGTASTRPQPRRRGRPRKQAA